MMRHDREFALACRKAHLTVADGMPVVWAMRASGQPAPERVPGVDLMDRLLAAAAQQRLSVYFLGATGNFASGDVRFFAGAGAAAGHDADDRVVYNTSTGQLYYDDDGSGAHAAQLVATLQAGAALAATDISVI